MPILHGDIAHSPRKGEFKTKPGQKEITGAEKEQLWYERIRSNVNYNVGQDRLYGGGGQLVHVYISPPISYTEVVVDFFGQTLEHPVEADKPKEVQALHKSGRRQRQVPIESIEFDQTTHRPVNEAAFVSGYTWDKYLLQNEVATTAGKNGSGRFDEAFLKATLRYEKHMDDATYLKIKAAVKLPAMPTPKQVYDMLEKIHEVYEATMVDQITLYRSVKAFLHEESVYESGIARMCLCLICPVWIGLCAYSQCTHDRSPEHIVAGCCPGHVQEEKCKVWLHGEGKERYISDKLKSAFENFADGGAIKRPQGQEVSESDVREWITQADMFHSEAVVDQDMKR